MVLADAHCSQAASKNVILAGVTYCAQSYRRSMLLTCRLRVHFLLPIVHVSRRKLQAKQIISFLTFIGTAADAFSQNFWIHHLAESIISLKLLRAKYEHEYFTGEYI